MTTAAKLKERLNLDCSVATIRNCLHRHAIHCRRPAMKIDLTDDHAQLRLNFVEQNLRRDWTNVIFCDEKVFSTSEDSRKFLWRLNNTRYDPRHIVRKRHSGRISTAYWGWMSSAGPGELTPISSRMDAVEYVGVLEDVLLPSVQLLYPPPTPITLVQDNSSVHSARVVRDWFGNHPQIELLPWPPKSPDLNPIENLWAIMINMWDQNLDRPIRNRENLHNHVVGIWESLRGRDTCTNLVNSMASRLENTRNANGYWTRY